MNTLNKDRIFAVGSTLLAMYLGYESFSYPGESALFPRTLSIILGSLAVLLFVRISFKRKIDPPATTNKQDCSTSASSHDLYTLKWGGFVFCSIITYGLLMSVINYEAATMVFLASLMILLGFKRPLAVAGLSGGLMLFLYVIFFKLLGVSRPESLFFQ